MQLKLIRKNLGNVGSSSNANIPQGDVTTPAGRLRLKQGGLPVKLALLLAGLLVQVTHPYAASAQGQRAFQHPASGQSVVVDWNRNLLVIVRTHGAQPATIHPTRSFAMMHAAIYDAVNAIDQTHEPYAAGVPHASRSASQEAAAAAAAHEVLVRFIPLSRRRSMRNSSSRSHRLRTAHLKQKASALDKLLATSSSPCAAMTVRAHSLFRMFSATLPAIINQRRRIFRRSLNSLTGRT